MAYAAHYALADGSVAHLSGVVPAIVDPDMKARYAGFVAVVGVTVYELAIKEIFCEFASKKHKTFGEFATVHFSRLNGRIKMQDLRGEHIKRFGLKYKDRFNKLVEAKDKAILLTGAKPATSCYDNMITWRHEFAHGGRPPTNATFEEVCEAYEQGKVVIECLFNAMVR
ncbi:HEPN domain-containing protein [Ferrovibrio sp.]|uniref:HEPN domain-containing protein n=1 Tax=Ferrovibrio sp. TaxID=1917215 RepID=UPI0035B2DE9D